MSTYTPVADAPSEPYSSTKAKTKAKYKTRVRNQSLAMIAIGIFISLFTYQYFHHGLWGKLNNYNKSPLIALNGTSIHGNDLNLTLYRPNGPDTYGAFVEKVTMTIPGTTDPIETWTPSMLSQIAPNEIQNAYPYQRVKTGPWGLVIPLSAKAVVKLPLSSDAMDAVSKASQAEVTVEDVSGIKWTYTVTTTH